MKAPLADRMRDIDVLVLDVDGVLTTGTVIYSDAGDELQAFHVRDGAGLSLWRKAGKRAAIVTGRGSKALERRAAELGINPVVQQSRDKAAGFESVLRSHSVEPRCVAVVTDDVPDLPMIDRAAVTFAVADAVPEIQAAADVITNAPGGRGAVREAIEWLLKAQGRWDELLRAGA